MWKARTDTLRLSSYLYIHTLEHMCLHSPTYDAYTNTHVRTHIIHTKLFFQKEFSRNISVFVSFLNTHQAYPFSLPLPVQFPVFTHCPSSYHIVFIHQNTIPVSDAPGPPPVLSAFIHCVCCSVLLWWDQNCLDMWHLDYERWHSYGKVSITKKIK